MDPETASHARVARSGDGGFSPGTYHRRVSATVLLVEDEHRTRRRLARALEAAPTLELCGVAEDLESGRAAFDALHPEVLLTDLGLPDGSGIELIAHARQSLPATQIMVITVFGDEGNVMAAIAAGAAGYLLKDGTDGEIAEAVSALLAGGSPISPSIARHLLRRFQEPQAGDGDAGLSPREKEVLDLVARGFSAPADPTIPRSGDGRPQVDCPYLRSTQTERTRWRDPRRPVTPGGTQRCEPRPGDWHSRSSLWRWSC